MFCPLKILCDSASTTKLSLKDKGQILELVLTLYMVNFILVLKLFFVLFWSLKFFICFTISSKRGFVWLLLLSLT